MPCVLTSNMTLGCRDSVGGIKTVYITELANKDTITSSAGVITAFELATGKKFWQYDLTKETAEFTEKPTPSLENGTLFYDTELKISLMKRDVTKRNEIHLLAQNPLMIIILDKNGLYWLMGEANGADLVPSESKSGKASGDFNGYALVFNAKEAQPMNTVQSSLIPDLLIAAS